MQRISGSDDGAIQNGENCQCQKRFQQTMGHSVSFQEK
jgi:hypothetical protein